jgi:hypothetical protein
MWQLAQRETVNGGLLLFKRPAFGYRNARKKRLLEIHFVYSRNKEIYCIFKTCCVISVLFSTKCRLFYNSIVLSSNDTFFINHAQKCKYSHRLRAIWTMLYQLQKPAVNSAELDICPIVRFVLKYDQTGTCLIVFSNCFRICSWEGWTIVDGTEIELDTARGLYWCCCTDTNMIRNKLSQTAAGTSA